MLKNKLIWRGLVGVLAIILLLGFAQIGSSSNPVPKNMPVALVMQDEKADLPNGQSLAIGQLIQDNLTKMPEDGKTPPLKWDILSSKKKVEDGLNDQSYYAAVIIPKDLSATVASLMSPNPKPAVIYVYINQGKNSSGANLVTQAAGKISEGINANLRNQLLAGIKAKGNMLTTEQAEALANPIIFQTKVVNPVPAHSANGNAPISFTILAWFGAIITTVILMIVSNKARTVSKAGNFMVILTQVVVGLLYAIVGAGSTVLLAKGILGMTIPDAWEFGLYFTIVCYCFFLIQTALVNWFGKAGIPLFVLMFFFGSPVLSLPEQMLPTISHDWLYSWIPLRFGTEVFRNVLYFGDHMHADGPLMTLAIIAGSALALSLLSSFVKSYSVVEKSAVEA